MATAQPDTSRAATDVAEFIADLDGGVFERLLSAALSEVAAAVVDHERKGAVSLKFELEQIPGTHQVRIAHTLTFAKPTSMGKASEESAAATVMHVGRFGRLSLAQPSLLERDERQQSIPL